MSNRTSTGKIKLALITSVIDNREGRGTALVARELLTRLLLERSEFDFVLIHHEPTDNPIYTEHPTLLIPHLPKPFDRQIFREAVFWIRLRLSGTHFDVVHYFNPRVWPSYILSTGPVMVTAHEAGLMLNLNAPSFGDRVFQFTYRFLHSRMACVIAVSEFGKREIAKYCKIPEERISVIPNALSSSFVPSELANRAEYLKTTYGFPSPYILSVGRLDPHKNILRLIDAYAGARAQGIQESLVLVGGRHLPDYSENVERKIAALSLSEHVFIAPFIPVTDLPHVYAEARALIYPSLHEGFGLPILEAAACGTPIAAANTTSLPEIAGDAALFFDPLDTKVMSDAIVRIVSDASCRDTLIKSGFARLSAFSWERGAAQLLSLYRSLR